MDSIRLSSIKVAPLHDQQKPGFSYQVDAVLYLDLSEAGRLNDGTQTVDYVQIVRRIVNLIQNEPANEILESLTAKVADSILLSHQIRRTRVTVTRLGADQGTGVDFQVGITLERAADDQVEGNPGSLESGRVNGAGNAALGHPSLLLSGQADSVHAAQARLRHPVTSSTQNDLSSDLENDNEVSSQSTVEGAQPQGLLMRDVIALEGASGTDRLTMLRALAALDGIPGSQLVGISPLYAYRDDQGDQRLSAVVILQTPLSLEELRSALDMVAAPIRQMGGLDADVVEVETLDGSVLSSQNHPPLLAADAPSRILIPWAYLEPEHCLPGAGGSCLASLSNRAPDRDRISLVSEDWILDGLS
ncbi:MULTISPECIES: dihydroneopterin aldolase [Bifidobacterium]|nr:MULTISPECIES: dihydroneopterin aldolase [Bifidobacterium]MBI0085623.1 dihydroneopterin aldolase [Bifidobacterium sp. M0404]